MTRLVILDRDGVINEDSDHYIRSAEQWLPIPGSIEAIVRLSQAGFTVLVATNQSGLSRGYFNQQQLDAMHDKLISLVVAQGGRIDGIYVCPHGPDDHCQCRKPATGLMEQIFRDYPAQPAKTWLVGDSLRDLQAGVGSGCKVALVLTGKGRKTRALLEAHPEQLATGDDVPVYNDLSSFAAQLLAEGF